MARYTLEKRIGEGGMAEVFRARAEGESGFSRVVAVKRLLPHFAKSPEVQARFVDEARIGSRLHHPCVVAGLDFYEEDGLQHLVLEFVDGVSVEHLVQRGLAGKFVPIDVIARIAYEAARGIEYAHAEGVLHRDVSCCNLLVSRAGEVKLNDFGLADARERISITAPGGLAGKATYMSPERRLGAKATNGDDLFALGVCVERLLAAADPRQRNTEDAGELAALAARLTAADPAERVPSASALLALLRPVPRASADALEALVRRSSATAPRPAGPKTSAPRLTADDLDATTENSEPSGSSDVGAGSPTGTDFSPRMRAIALGAALVAAAVASLLLLR